MPLNMLKGSKRSCKTVAFFVGMKVVVVILVLIFGREFIAAQFGQSSQSGCDHVTNVTAVCPATQNFKELPALSNVPEVHRTMDHDPSRKPRVMCLLFTTPEKYLIQARAVNDTWARRCDLHRWFITTDATKAKDIPPDVVPLKVPEGRGNLVEKSLTAFRYAYIHHLEDADWFLKADDDTYIIMENLRHVLAHYDPQKAHYIGGMSSALLPHGYNGGGAGYTLSREALKLIVAEGHRSPTACRPHGDFEDLEMGRCLASFKVFPVDTRDRDFRLTFHPDHPYKILAGVGDARSTYTYRKDGAPYPKGIRTMSPHTVSFHSVAAPFMYMYDFLLYDLERRHDFILPDPVPQRAHEKEHPDADNELKF